jgi:type I restriction enzyme S subunit
MSWPEVPIGEIFEVARGGSPRPIDEFITDDPDGLNWVMIGDATSGGKYITRTKKKIRPEGLKKTRAVKPGDFILSNSMSFGKPYIMGIEGCIHDGWLLLRPQSDQVDPDYFYHLLGSEPIYAKFAGRAAGATVKNLNSDIVREVEVPLPPLGEQRRIAGILDQADALRRLRFRALDKLNALGQAIFFTMFGGDHSLPRVPLDELIEVRSSLADPTLAENAELPHVGPEHIRQAGGQIDWDRVRTCHEDGVTSGKYRFEPGDVIYSKIRPYLNKVAISDRTGMCSADMYAIVPREDRIKTRYLHFALGSTEFLTYADRVSGRANIPKMNRKQLMAFELPLPSIELQEQFEEQLGTLVVERDRHVEQNIKLNQIFASLQHCAFKGEL